jgi:hypothetical protein
MRLVDPLGTELFCRIKIRVNPASDPEPLQMTKIHIKDFKIANFRQYVVESYWYPLDYFRKNLVGVASTFS